MTFSLCPICSVPGSPYYQISHKNRPFLLCLECTLIYQEEMTLPSAEEERTRYELHRNDPADEGYRKWLHSFIHSSVLPWYKDGRILDFGSGPHPVLSDLLKEQGYPVVSYDPFFAPQWPGEHDFSLILLCEVLEHISNPLSSFRKLCSLASEGTVLSLKTQFLTFSVFDSEGGKDFEQWWYKEDPTHIRFYNPRSLRILGERSGWELVSEDGSSLAVYKKAASLKESRSQ
ncbi:class I SAM-dependent methyltransferase [Oceanispirochaeta sp.]|uniref:class I SAM-dependent methyltransferase n=1 Tax=Oceanispirochaeta sp. TaxID=2035350 RepID=UPI002623D1A8|nr:class I SAM-dependent methyltransferase [Oceanispirochaeta sp.]MDA3956418.1 class I SAM-dependent methyltransferase [Oceanispirochaeta sp.]